MSEPREGPADECWEWTGSLGTDGYGSIGTGSCKAGTADRPRHLRAHRVVYEMLVGPIPEGLQIDHLCRNRPCVNPAHLEPVTAAENIRRAIPYRRRKGMVA